MAELPFKKPAIAVLHFPHPVFDGKRILLLSLILALQLLLLLLSRSLSSPSPLPSPDLTISFYGDFPSEPTLETCPQGLIFVYDLPSSLNKDLLSSCETLSHWGSRCAAVSNAGFGPSAGDLSGAIPTDLLSSWFSTDQFSLELIFHRRMLNYRCRTYNASSAAAFYVPFYGGVAAGKYLFGDYTAKVRDLHGTHLVKWLSRQNPFKKSNGWDHFLVLGRISWDFRRLEDHHWGSSLLFMPQMANVTRFLIERNQWDPFDVAVPYPTGFHPKTSEDLQQWQRFVLSRRRETLFSFAGGKRSAVKNDFRELLLQRCENSKNKCRSVKCSELRCVMGLRETVELFLGSRFCLQPRGDSFTRRSIFDCMVAGGIPVFFWKRTAYTQYQWFLPQDREYSVFIEKEAVKNGSVEIEEYLEGIGQEREMRMRETVVGMIQRMVYALPAGGLGSGFEDAFDVAVSGMLRRVKEQNH